MALTQDSTGYYLDSGTGQYYKPMPNIPRSSYGYGMNLYGGPVANAYWSGIGSLLSQATGNPIVADSIVFDGKAYVPFKGDTAGISAGKKSMVQDLISRANAATQNVNVPTLQSMFHGMTTPSIAPVAPLQGNVYQAPLAQSTNQYFAPWAVNKRGASLAPNKQPSMADVLINRAESAYTPAPTAAQLFPSMSFAPSADTTQGSYGAGRFTGGLLK